RHGGGRGCQRGFGARNEGTALGAAGRRALIDRVAFAARLQVQRRAAGVAEFCARWIRAVAEQAWEGGHGYVGCATFRLLRVIAKAGRVTRACTACSLRANRANATHDDNHCVYVAYGIASDT